MTDSRRLVLDQHYRRLSQLYKANDILDSKAMGLFHLTSLGLFGLIGMSIFVGNLFIGIASIPLGLMIILAVAWIPQDDFCPGSDDWNEIYTQYINKDYEACFDQVLSDCVETSEKLLAINNRKAKLAKISTVLFCLQWVGYLLFVYLVF